MAKAAKEETKVTEMENKIEKMTQFLADNKIECFDIQKWRTSITPLSSAAAWK